MLDVDNLGCGHGLALYDVDEAAARFKGDELMGLMRGPVYHIPSHQRQLPPVPVRPERPPADDADVGVHLPVRVHGQHIPFKREVVTSPVEFAKGDR